VDWLNGSLQIWQCFEWMLLSISPTFHSLPSTVVFPHTLQCADLELQASFVLLLLIPLAIQFAPPPLSPPPPPKLHTLLHPCTFNHLLSNITQPLSFVLLPLVSSDLSLSPPSRIPLTKVQNLHHPSYYSESMTMKLLTLVQLLVFATTALAGVIALDKRDATL
jgi:hypothetical protein